MKPRIRAHANFSEYTPLFIGLLALAEYQGLAVLAVHAIGLVFVIGRFFHAYGLMIAEPQERWFGPRVFGMAATFSCLAALAAILLFQFASSVAR